jgi:hypothetical protein
LLSKEGLLRLFFPEKLRTFPQRRNVRMGLRTIHILTTGILLGGHVFNQPVAILEPWLFAAIASGLLLLLTDLHASVTILLEFRGMVALLKIALVCLIPFFWKQRIFLLIVVLTIGAVSSHMSGKIRHRRLLFSNCEEISYSKN